MMEQGPIQGLRNYAVVCWSSKGRDILREHGKGLRMRKSGERERESDSYIETTAGV
jgi:hypothetical protein